MARAGRARGGGRRARLRAYWDRAARENAVWYVDTGLDYDRPDMEAFFERGRRIAEEALHGFEPDRDRHVCLDLGAGLGRVSAALAPRFRHVVALDVSEEMLRRAARLAGPPNRSLVLVEPNGLAAIRPGSVDFVVCFAVLQHLPSVRAVLASLGEAARVLRPGGRAAIQLNTTPGSVRWAVRRSALAAMPGRRPVEARYFLGSRVPLRRLRAHLERLPVHDVEIREPGTLFTMVHFTRR